MTKTILLLFGGESPEHEVSIMSAQNVAAAINQELYEVILCYIDSEGGWWHVPEILQYTDTSELEKINPVLGGREVSIGSQLNSVDCVFPVLHGSNGEDGSVQALAKLLHVPIVGCGVTASALCIDKALTKQILEVQGVPIVPYVVHDANDDMPTFADVSQKLGSTVFVKPARLGSSIGVRKASTAHEFEAALNAAHEFDDKVLIEQAIDARELETAVLGAREIQVSVIGEIIPDREFYTYESKYDDTSDSAAEIPAHVDNSVYEQIQNYARTVFKTLGCNGLARIDFFLDRHSGKVYLNEINTMPGFTNISMYPKLWQASGLEYPQLVEKLIELAE